MTTYAADTFTRADNSTSLGNAETGGAWTAQSGVWGIFSNFGFRMTHAPSNDSWTYATLSVAQADVTVSADIQLSGTLNRAAAGLTLRWASATNNLSAVLIKSTAEPNSIQINQLVGGVFTRLGEVTSAGLANNTSYAVKVVISGTTITVFVDNVQKLTASFDASLTTQKYGLALYRGATDYDDANSFWNNYLITDNAVETLIPRLNPLLNANIYRM